jgi:hypothetical protein
MADSLGVEYCVSLIYALDLRLHCSYLKTICLTSTSHGCSKFLGSCAQVRCCGHGNSSSMSRGDAVASGEVFTATAFRDVALVKRILAPSDVENLISLALI